MDRVGGGDDQGGGRGGKGALGHQFLSILGTHEGKDGTRKVIEGRGKFQGGGWDMMDANA